MSGLTQYYKTLELENGASLEEVKQAYKDLAMVWHPDRFSNNARLQQKAQNKFKEISKAYEQLRSCQHNHSRICHSPRQPQRPQPSQGQATSKRQAGQQPGSKQPQPGSQPAGSRSGRRQYDPIISLQQARAILAEYEFKLIRHFPDRCISYESGPFCLDIRENIPEVVISVPCDSVSRFHRALLSIPCKSVGTFHQSEAQALIDLFRSSGSEG